MTANEPSSESTEEVHLFCNAVSSAAMGSDYPLAWPDPECLRSLYLQHSKAVVLTADLGRVWEGVQLQCSRSTTVLCVRKNNDVVMVADGQVTLGNHVMKPNVHKLRRVNDRVIGGFAGSTADAFTLFDNLEIKIEEHPDQIMRAAVELAKLWRTDKFLRKLDASLIVADADTLLEITGQGDVLEPHDGVLAIGSGSTSAVAAARALIDIPNLTAKDIADKAMKIAADADIYTNHNLTWETLDIKQIKEDEEKKEKELEESVKK